MEKQRYYLCIDLKSFYASVECVERGLDPMTTNLVVADPDRSKGTICLAITPSMKKLGIKNRCRIYEIPKSVDYIIAPPRMKKYIDYSANIIGVYLKYISKDDIYVYSIDESFIDVTPYLSMYGKTPKEMAVFLMNEVEKEIGVRSSAGVGTNLYLAKIALDITAKHAEDFIGYLDEDLYIKTLWDHRPLTDFWRVGPGTQRRLEKYGIRTMRDIASADEDLLYSLFGIDAELLIDHAYGREPVTIQDIKKYRPKSNSISSGQVMMRDYTAKEGELIVREMLELICLDMVDKGVVTDSFTIYVGYSHTVDAPASRGSVKLQRRTSADSLIIPAVIEKYRQIVLDLPIRRFNISCNDLSADSEPVQMTLFGEAEDESEKKNREVQKAVLKIHKRYGKNSLLKLMNFEEGATTRERNGQIGGHKSGQKG